VSNTFLLGAGASAFSGPCAPQAPPLGKDLFAALTARGGVFTRFGTELTAAFADFEEGMALLRVKRPDLIAPVLRDMADYFSHFAPEAKNLHYDFIEAVLASGSPACVASLNYDLLLELAANRSGHRITYGAPPVPPRNLAILKIHGSCNFLPTFGGNSIQGITLIPGNETTSLVDSDIKVGSPEEVQRYCREQTTLAPALAMYARGKKVWFSDRFVHNQHQQWVKALSTASRIVIIGVHLNTDDEHIWEPLRESRGRLLYAGPEGPDVLSWARMKGRDKAFHIANSFAEAVSLLPRLLRV
jgi:hypothetical protein